jgi:hypothetical protein
VYGAWYGYDGKTWTEHRWTVDLGETVALGLSLESQPRALVYHPGDRALPRY